MILEKIICNFLMTNCYFFGDDKTNEIIIIDPGGEELAIERRIKNRKYNPVGIVFTHGHPDHTIAGKYLKDKFKIPVYFHPNEKKLIPIEDFIPIKEPESIKIGNQELFVLDTPGHTSGGICLVSYQNKIIFTGDTLFRGSIGRTDLGNGNFYNLVNSIKNKIIRNEKINKNFIIYPGHDEESTINFEIEYNIFRKDFL